jgi:hypothetical protein
MGSAPPPAREHPLLDEEAPALLGAPVAPPPLAPVEPAVTLVPVPFPAGTFPQEAPSLNG